MAFPALAQVVTGGQVAPSLPAHIAQNNVTVVYSTVTGQPLMVVVDAIDLTDLSFNPPNSAQVSIPVAQYNQMVPADLQNFMNANAPSPVAVAP